MTQNTTYFSWLDVWIKTYKKAQVQEQTYVNSLYYATMLKNSTNDILLSEVNEMYLQTILNSMADEGYAKGTLQKIRCIIRQSIHKAFKNSFINEDYSNELIIPKKAPVKTVEALTSEEQGLVEAACGVCTNGDFVVFLLFTGLRRHEFIQLEWSDFDVEKAEIKVRKSKTQSGIRTVPLVRKALEIILRQPRVDQYIFHNDDGSRASNSSMKKLAERIRVLTDINKFTTHVCRHTFATRLVENGASPKSVATLLGHKRVEYALNIYTNLGKERLRKDIFLLEDKVG